ncbi:hypothetical protein TVAG_365970 [Trichomonas vaginalis G3]|uniref:DUF3447 domain-containing protein n=1 Tax=Trichomonas vaginalis (strain ATCC PRA-98 / G3) TaxID=412133 RepID=A2DHP1_TRIV3|nr:protein ubiquitination [Trichomonas vaginalis G3]EAY20089.1 hypothetical protein TVAG_365970 [Trichomonas vaginalis G3]KAI5528042.1 protein ubiquitination [Trichomonas vaginalis G3]|eukprot:XP_001581075.1 hypothetical protein [Trichomonas vaginalis G3]
MKEEEILNLYPAESPLYYIAWDKVDDLKSKFPEFDINQTINNEITSLDCAIKYGSESCFNHLKKSGANYTNNSEKYAVQGGNQNIFKQMIEEGKTFDKMINTALDYHNFEIAGYLKSKFGQFPNSVTGSMNFGNFNIVSYLLSNGADINKIEILFIFTFTIVLWDSLLFSYLSRFYRILYI